MVIAATVTLCVFAGVLMLYTLSASSRNEIDLIDAHRAVIRAKAEYAERTRLQAEIQALNGAMPMSRAA